VYDPSDPRAALTTTGSGVTQAAGGPPRPAQFYELNRLEPDEITPSGTRTWLIRTQHLVLACSAAVAGETLACDSTEDDCVVLLPDEIAAADVAWETERESVTGPSLTVVPAGRGSITIRESGIVVRLFTSRSTPLTSACRNADAYREPDPNTAPFIPWPPPGEGSRLRVYDYGEVPADALRLGRIYRCSAAMLNIFYPQSGPRDPSKLSPHHHLDFEQMSLQVAGDFVHHVRTPWGTDLQEWREDEHRRCSSPAISIFPPPLIHTSQAVGHTEHQLIDIFGPPRHDFSSRPGWVLNADDYPAL
jgi:hypothetical protein